MPEPLPIDNRMIQQLIDVVKDDIDIELTRDEAIAEIESLRRRGCMLYDDCRSCPLFGTKCPL